MPRLLVHPFRAGVQRLIDQHFAPEVAGRFVLMFEAEAFNKESPNIVNQLRDDTPILQLYYQKPGGLTEFVCDLYPWEPQPATEARLLRYVTDAVKSGKFGADWEEGKDGRINAGVLSGQFGTADEPING